jgi:hypothetical protein
MPVGRILVRDAIRPLSWHLIVTVQTWTFNLTFTTLTNVHAGIV